MTYKPIAAVLCIVTLLVAAGPASAQSLVGNVFVTGFDGWTDTHVVDPLDAGAPTWGVLLGDDDALCEANDMITGANTGTRRNDAISQNLINMNYSTTSAYTLTANIATWDDDGYGLIFGYVDESNYFRVGVRQQEADTYGFPMGISLTKVIGGTMTTCVQNTDIRTSLPYNDGVYYDLSVTVDGAAGTVAVYANPGGGSMVECLSYQGNPFSDPDFASQLASMAAGHYGVHSWAQKEAASAESSSIKPRGTCIKTLTVDDGSDSIIDRTHTFADAVPINWRPIMMTNAEGDQGGVGSYGLGDGTPAGFNYGNFRQDFRNGTIFDDSNSFVWSTATAPNVDFLGGAIVVDETGSDAWTDYDMKVRITSGDDEGPGVLVRVQDDNTFYRINFATQGMGTSGTRSPDGLSIQKCVDNGTDPPIWTELYRDDQVTPTFQYTDNVPFDLKVSVVGNAITVSLIDDPDGAATLYTWDTVYDTTDAILSGSVGFTNWGAGDQFNGVYYSAYGGVEGPLVVVATIDRIPGDANGDLKVDAADVSIMAANWGAVSATWEMGDFSENGTVGPEDAKLLAQNWGTGGGSEAAAVPEPGTMILLLGALVGLIGVRRR